MGIDMDKDGRVGCSYYIAIDGALFVEEDIFMGGIEAVETILLRVQPTTILVPARALGVLVEFLERGAQRLESDEASDNKQGLHILRHLGSAEFDYDAGKVILAKVDLGPNLPDFLEVESTAEHSANYVGSPDHSNLMRLAKTINLESYLSIGCAGAVVNDLNRRISIESLDTDAERPLAFQIRSMKMSTPADTMLMSADALISLQIIRSELHPNPQIQCSNRSQPKLNECLSVSGLLQGFACTAQGKAKLRRMLFRPSTDVKLIHERQRAIATFLRVENHEALLGIRKHLRKIKNTKTLLLHVRKGVDRMRGQLSLRTGDWKVLLRFAMASIQLRESVSSLLGSSDIDSISKIRSDIDPRIFISIGETILKTINFKLSMETGRTEILTGASDNLDELRREFAHVCQILPEIKGELLRDIPEWAAEHIHHCTVIPQLGFLVAVTLNPETGEGVYSGQELTGDAWHISFISEDLVYYKTSAMADLDLQHGDLSARIADEEIRVAMELAAVVLEHENAIVQASELFGEFDSLLSLAFAAEKYGWVAPEMTTSNIIDILDGRHPLQELLVSSFIPNNCRIAGGVGGTGAEDKYLAISGDDEATDPSMLILTGPNNSGKSVYMKQVALIVYLAHIGSYVPATRATIGITDQILTRIATRETVVDDESAFLVDLKQAAFSMNFATRRSLLLIDEFGKGTTMEAGAALFAAYLIHFLDLDMEKPKVLVGTHFHEIFEHGFIGPRDGVAFAHMEVRLNPEAQDAEDQLTFLFKLLEGRDERSLGVLCAAINDIPSDVIKRASYIVSLQESNEDLVEAYENSREFDQGRLEEAELVARRFLAIKIPRTGRGREDISRIRAMLEEVLSIHDEDTDMYSEDRVPT
ncbi:muts domain V-domain-containing protein [Lasiosphaeria ovina]|uniref:DNA mismatch repair protein MSH5 n=1 Tax=Lasiosphaeria ovina TaxID=92902 RepID=A0AAE0NLZ5_9PEZI|nr:muts domain V-domain-containing protein [Lasiosphaeria ovina]